MNHYRSIEVMVPQKRNPASNILFNLTLDRFLPPLSLRSLPSSAG